MTISNAPAVDYGSIPPAPLSLERALFEFNERVGRLLVDLAAIRWGDNGLNQRFGP